MITVKSKNQFGEEILVNVDKIAYAVPSLGGLETVIFFDNDTHINILEPFNDFKGRFGTKPTVKVSEHNTVINNESTDEYPEHLPRLPTGNVDKRTNQYKDWVASKQESVAHHSV